MPWVDIPFWTGSAEADSKDVSAQRLVNWYLAQSPQNSKSPFYLVPTPGLILRGTYGDGGIRGATMLDRKLLLVSGTRLYSIEQGYAGTDIGEVKGSGHVWMVSNTTETLIVTSGDEVYYTDGATVSVHGETALRGAAYTDGYAAAIADGSDQFYLYGPDAINTLQGFSSADRKPDYLVGVGAVGGQLWLMGEATTEVWQHTGASFPFERVQTFDFGTKSGASVVVEDNAIWWAGDDNLVYKAPGLQPQSISPPWISRIAQARPSPQTSEAFVHVFNGRRQYVLSYADKTLVYDDATGLWHERQSFNESRWRAGNYVFAWGRHLVCDFENGNLYELDQDTYTENGTTIRREADSPIIHAKGDRAYMAELHIDMESGVGLESGQGSSPTLMLTWSDDGGNTWSNELTQSIGEIGDYGAQVRFNRLGYFRKRIIRIAVSDPVNAIVIGARARVEAVDS